MIVAIGSVSQYHATLDAFLQQRTNLIESNLLFGLKADLFRHARFPATLCIGRPVLGKIQLIPGRKAGLLGGQRHADRDAAVVLLTHLPAILTRNSDRVDALLWKPRVIHDPGNQPVPPRHRRQHLVAHLSQQCGIAPGRIGHDVMQRLMHLANVTGRKTRGHGLNTLALQGQQQPLRVVFHRDNAIGVSAAARQLLQIIFKTL